MLRVFSLNAWFDDIAVRSRLSAIVYNITKKEDELPDTLLFQELTPVMFDVLCTKLFPYHYVTPSSVVFQDRPYGEAIFVRSPRLELIKYYRFSFPTSSMGRELQVVECLLKEDGKYVTSSSSNSSNSKSNEKRILFGTAHLESLRQYSEERLKQLNTSLSLLSSMSEDGKQAIPWIFAGDTNLGKRDSSGISLPSGCSDAWDAAGNPIDHQYTWDVGINKNLPDIKFVSKCRFDRCYFASQLLTLKSFETGCKEPLSQIPLTLDENLIMHDANAKNTGFVSNRLSKLYPSDHWSISMTFDIGSSCQGSAKNIREDDDDVIIID